MLTEYPSPTTRNKRKQPQTHHHSCNISRVLAAAVINKGFRELLLSDPARALSQGFQGEEFPLDYDQKALIKSIRAESLSDFALQITSFQETGAAGCSTEWIPVNQPAFILDAK
jgi:hypothetical protein